MTHVSHVSTTQAWAPSGAWAPNGAWASGPGPREEGRGAHDIHRPHGLSPLHPRHSTACGWRRGGCGWDVVLILMSTHAVGSFPFKKAGMFDQQQLCFLEVFHFVVLNKDPDSSLE